MAVSGAQDPVYLADAMERALRRSRSAAARSRHRPPQPNKRYRASRSASTRIALAAIHEPTMRTPMRCQGRVACDATRATSANVASAATRDADLRRDRGRNGELVRRRIERSTTPPAASASSASSHRGGAQCEHDETRRQAPRGEQADRGRRFAHRRGDGTSDAGRETEPERRERHGPRVPCPISSPSATTASRCVGRKNCAKPAEEGGHANPPR